MEDGHGKVSFNRRSAKRTLLGCALLIGVVWLWVLSTIGQVPRVRADIDRLDAAGINASALYWTELDDDRLWQRSAMIAPLDQAVASPLGAEP